MDKGGAVSSSQKVGIIQYDQMIHAIDKCTTIIEVVDKMAKATALQRYAKISRNVDAENKCRSIRVWAATKYGELAREAIKAKGGPTKGAKRDGRRGKLTDSPRRELVSHGINKNQRAIYQQLAQAPEKVKAYLAEATSPTIDGALAAVNPKKKPQGPKPKPRGYSDAAMLFRHHLSVLESVCSDASGIAKGTDARMRESISKSIDAVYPFLNQLRGLL